MTTTPLATIVCSHTSSLLSIVTIATTLMGLPATSDQHDVVLPPPLTPRHSGGVIGLATVLQQQPPSQMSFQAYGNYAMGPPQVGFSFRVKPPTVLYFYMSGVCSGVCFLFSGTMLDAVFTNGALPVGFTPLEPFGAYPWQTYVQRGIGHWSTPGMHRVAAPSTAFSRGSLLLLNQLSSSHSNYMVGHTGLETWQRITHSLHFPCLVGRHLLSQVWFHLMTQLALNLWWALNLVILVWWLGIRLMSLLITDLLSGLLLIPIFILGSQVRCHHWPTFPWNQGCEDYSFLNQAVADFEQGLVSILTDSIKTPELDISLGEPDAVTSSLSSRFLQLVNTISDTSKLQLAPSIRSHKLWCHAWALLASVPLATKMSASKLICYFSSHPAAFGFQSSTSPDNITFTPTSRKADQSLLEFQTGIGAAAHATINMEQLISHLRVALVDTISSLPNSGGGVIPVSKVHELLTKVHDILDSAVSKWVGKSAQILAHVFYSASRQHHEVWASKIPFLNSLKDVVPPSEACLYDHINWSLAQAKQLSSIGLSQSFLSKKSGKARPQTGFHFTVQKRPAPGYSYRLQEVCWW